MISSQSESSRLLPARASQEHGATEESVEVIRIPSNDSEEATENPTAEIRQEGSVTQLTRRLRCLFRTLTSPIIPLATILAVALLWVLYAAFVLDLRKSCSRPLHGYAIISLVTVSYATFHSHVRNYLFSYSPERNGPPRPIAVRMYDQLYHTLCILYVYGGVTLIEACVEDAGNHNNGNDAVDVLDKDQETPATDGNTCSSTCPNLYQALSIYVTTLELFTFSLILPLLFLPCVYLWIIRRASAEAEAFSQFQDRMEEEEALINNGGLTTQEIMDSLEKVKLTSTNDCDVVVLMPVSADDETSLGAREGTVARECCICMTEFDVHRIDDLESGLSVSEEPNNDDDAENNNNDDNIIVRTKCKHLFHGSCLAGWLGGRWEPNRQESSERSQRRARRTACPLCREDLKPARNS